MKSVSKKLVSVMFVLALTVVMFIVPCVNAQAAAKPKLTKSSYNGVYYDYEEGYHIGTGAILIRNLLKTDKVEVVSAGGMNYYKENFLQKYDSKTKIAYFECEKPGTYKVKLRVTRGTRTFDLSARIEVAKVKNNFCKSLRIGKTEYVKKISKEMNVNLDKKVSGKISVKTKGGYKVAGIYLSDMRSAEQVKKYKN